MGAFFKVAVFVALAGLVIGGCFFLAGVLEDSSPFFGKLVIIAGIGVVITIFGALANEAIKMAPGLISP